MSRRLIDLDALLELPAKVADLQAALTEANARLARLEAARPAPPSDEDRLTVEECAAVLGCSTKTVRRRLATLKPERRNGKIYVRRGDLVRP